MSYWDQLLREWEWQDIRSSLRHTDSVKAESVQKLVNHIEALEDLLKQVSPDWRERVGIN